MTSQLTILNSMADPDFDRALAIHKEWGLKWLDLRDGIYGNWVANVDLDSAKRAREAIDASGLDVFCMSTSTFFEEIEKGEELFREKHLGKLGHLIELGKIFKPKVMRIIAAQLPSREPGENAVELIEKKYPWVFDVYREAVDRIVDAGLRPTIENEAFKCMLSQPGEIVEFFDRLDRKNSVDFTWDVQNQWATGVFPTLEVYEQLRPLIQYYHVKGGATEGDDRKLRWNVALEDADWPVVEITSKVVADGVSPVICINPAQHGENKPDYDYSNIVKRDIDFLRNNVPGVE
ncbi:sugar phosphate isomerase/epimerase family protein [Aliihoeflea sp. PC F10.4]